MPRRRWPIFAVALIKPSRLANAKEVNGVNLAEGCSWHKAAVPARARNVRCLSQSGPDAAIARWIGAAPLRWRERGAGRNSNIGVNREVSRCRSIDLDLGLAYHL